MLISRQIARQLQRRAPQDGFPPVGYENGIFFLEDNEKQSYLGACWMSKPLAGIDSATMKRLHSLMASGFPAATFVQFHLISVPDVEFAVNRYLGPKLDACQNAVNISEDQADLLREVAKQRAQHLLDGRDTSHVSSGVRANRVFQVISVKVPTEARPSDRDWRECTELFDKFMQSLATAGFDMKRCDSGQYLSILRFMFEPYRPYDCDYDESKELRDQVFPLGFSIDYSNSRQLSIGSEEALTHVRVLSVNRYPKLATIGIMNMIAGDPSGLNNQFSVPWVATLALHFPDRIKKQNWFKNKHALLTVQANGQIARFIQRMGMKKAAFDRVAAQLEDGDPLIEASFSIMLYSRDEREVTRMGAQMSTYMAGYGLDLREDTEILWPLLWNNLPLFPSDTSIFNLHRYTTMQLRAALQFAPILCDWTVPVPLH